MEIRGLSISKSKENIARGMSPDETRYSAICTWEESCRLNNSIATVAAETLSKTFFTICVTVSANSSAALAFLRWQFSA